MVSSLTVRDILERPYFQGSTVHASDKALSRTVEWVHILEVTHVGHLLNGNELILTTGLIWKDDEELGISFLQQVMVCNASGLCIELGRVVSHLPEAMIQLAAQSDFPLILIHHNIRYIDITRDIHSWIINQQRKKVTELEELSTRFNELLLTANGLSPLLVLYHQATHKPVAYVPLEGKPLFLPPMSDREQRHIIQNVTATQEPSHRFASKSIIVLQHTLGELISWSDEPLDSYDILALDRCAAAVAQELMRTFYWEERQMYKQNQWVHDWLNGLYEEREIKQYVWSLKPAYSSGLQSVIVFELNRDLIHSPDFERMYLHKNMMARALFEQEGFYLIPTLLNQQLVYILLDLQKRKEIHSGLARAVSRLRQADNQYLPLFSLLFGAGQPVNELSSIKKSLNSALDTISMQKEIGPLPMPFYNQLHLYRVIFNLRKSDQLLDNLIEDYIGPVAGLDRERREPLLCTLKMYLMLNGAKRETAKALYISRQSLYSRLDKISELLGDDFMSPEKRFCVELAVYAHEYLKMMQNR
ncbi:PucR family transcriptional regulator [Cohnella sp.]|uniref:PucR family transcriptional regulator n=1 Tax=Cohnella sp. TaxID=1883426 RepID=UPI00356399ED